jgi:hypothetical protein
MRTLCLLASTAVVVGVAAALAAPAGAQSAVDQAFLGAVRDKGVPIASDAQALDLAHSTCGTLSDGGSAVDALTKIANATNWSEQQATDFGGLAVVAYCNDLMSQALAPAQQQQSDPSTRPKMNVPKVTEDPRPLPPPHYYPYGPPRPPRH